MLMPMSLIFFFFFNDTATTEIYTLSLHDALPISLTVLVPRVLADFSQRYGSVEGRSEDHTSELQSRRDLVCRLLLEKKKKYIKIITRTETGCARAATEQSVCTR